MKSVTDLNFREKLVLVPIFVFIVWIGIYPTTFLKISDKTSEHIINLVTSPENQIPIEKIDVK